MTCQVGEICTYELVKFSNTLSLGHSDFSHGHKTTYPKVNSLVTIECFVIVWSHLERVVWSCDIYK